MVATEASKTAAHSPPTVGDERALATLEVAVERLSAGFPAEAVDDLQQLCDDYPHWAVARAYYGTALFGMSKVVEARELLESALELAPESFICHLRYAEFLARNGFHDQAVAQLDAALHVPAPSAGARDAAIALRSFCRQKARGMFYRETPNLRSRFQPLLSRLAWRKPATTVTTER